MIIPPDALVDQYRRAAERWPWLADVEAAHDLPAYLLFALGSRETGLDPAYAEGKAHADGHGWGLFGADDRWNSLDLPAFASDPRAQATLAASTLAANLARTGDLADALNAYGPADGRPGYGLDVAERRQFLAEHLGPPALPVDDTPPAELDPYATSHGAIDAHR